MKPPSAASQPPGARRQRAAGRPAAAGRQQGRLTLPTAAFAGPFAVSIPTAGPVWDVASADFNQDGIEDFAVATGSATQVYYGLPDGGFAFGQSISGFEFRLIASDINGDGRPDLNISAADLDMDGRKDIASCAHGSRGAPGGRDRRRPALARRSKIERALRQRPQEHARERSLASDHLIRSARSRERPSRGFCSPILSAVVPFPLATLRGPVESDRPNPSAQENRSWPRSANSAEAGHEPLMVWRPDPRRVKENSGGSMPGY